MSASALGETEFRPSRRLIVSMALVVVAVGGGFATAKGGNPLYLAILAAAAVAIAPLLSLRRLALVLLPFSVVVPPGVAVDVAGVHLGPSRIVLFGAAVGIFARSAGRAATASARGTRRLRVLAVPLGAWALLVGVSFVGNRSNAGAFSDFLQLALDPCLAVLVLWASVNDRTDLRVVAKSVVAALAASSAVALVEFASGRYLIPTSLGLLETRERLGWLRPRGLMAHPIILGVTSCIGILLVVGLRLAPGKKSEGRLSRIGAALLIALFGSSVYLAQSRGAQATLVAVLGIGALVSGRSSIRRKANLVLFFLLLLVLTPLGVQIRGQFQGGDGSTSSLELDLSTGYRRQLVPALLDFARSHPLGVGPGVSPLGSVPGTFNGTSIDFSRTIDNAYLVALYKFGYAGLALMIASSVGAAVNVLSLGRKRLRATSGSLTFLLGLSLLTVVIAGLSVATFSWSQLNLLFWILAGAGIAEFRASVDHSDPAQLSVGEETWAFR